MLLIGDTAVAHDIAGIMGGMHSSVTEETNGYQVAFAYTRSPSPS